MRTLFFSWLSTLVWLFFCVVVFIGVDGVIDGVVVSLFSLLFFTTLMLWRSVYKSTVAPLELMFWLFHTNFLLLPALNQVYNSEFYWSPFDSYSKESLYSVCCIVAIGLLAFKVGLILGKRKTLYVDVGVGRVSFLARSMAPRFLANFFLLTVILILSMMVMKLGVDFFTGSRSEGMGFVNTKAQFGMLLVLPRALAFGVLLTSVSLLMVKKFHSGRWWASKYQVMFFLLSLGVNSIINFPLGASRFWVFGFLIALIWIMGALDSVKRRLFFVIGMTFMQFTVFPWYSQITRGKGLVGFDIESIRAYMRHGDFDGFQSLANIFLYIQSQGFEYGRNLISVILFFIPRQYWNKSEPLGVVASRYMEYEFTNLSAPIYGEFYVDFGLLSLIVGMAFFGYWLRIYDRYYCHVLKSGYFGVGILLVGVLSGYLIILLRGSLLGVVPGVATLFVMLVVSCLFFTSRSRLVKRYKVVNLTY